MTEEVRQFEEWYQLYQNHKKNDSNSFYFLMMTKTASTKENWKVVFSSSPDKESRKMAFQKIVEKTEGFDELYSLCEGKWGWIAHNNMITEKILQIDNLTFDQLRKIYYFRRGQYLREILLTKMLRIAKTPEELFWLIQASKKNKPIWEIAHQLLEQLNK